jgi:DNA-binding CsgD family transcriptional regulator
MNYGRPLAAFTVTTQTALGALLRDRATFPWNLTAAERRTVELCAYSHRSQRDLAERVGVGFQTFATQLSHARKKAGANSTAELSRLYRQATERNAA